MSLLTYQIPLTLNPISILRGAKAEGDQLSHVSRGQISSMPQIFFSLISQLICYPILSSEIYVKLNV